MPIYVRRNITLAEAPSYGQTIFEYDPSCNGAADYLAVAQQIEPRVEKTVHITKTVSTNTKQTTPDGTCIRDFIHVEDLAEAHVLALEYLAGGCASGFLNLGTGTGHSVKEVVTTIERVIGRELKKRIVGRRPGDPPVLFADPSRAQKLLGWKATRSLQDMVSSAWKFHQLHSPRAHAVSER